MQSEKSHLQPEPKRLPRTNCIICGKAIDEIGGKRIIAQKYRGITISTQSSGHASNSDFIHKNIKIGPLPLYLVIWGEKTLWTDHIIEHAIEAVMQGRRPWFCQLCGQRVCSTCGHPINYPMGSDILHDNGCSSHCGIFPFNPGCTNRACKQFKKFEASVEIIM